jgi:hypothetical protein
MSAADRLRCHRPVLKAAHTCRADSRGRRVVDERCRTCRMEEALRRGDPNVLADMLVHTANALEDVEERSARDDKRHMARLAERNRMLEQREAELRHERDHRAATAAKWQRELERLQQQRADDIAQLQEATAKVKVDIGQRVMEIFLKYEHDKMMRALSPDPQKQTVAPAAQDDDADASASSTE